MGTDQPEPGGRRGFSRAQIQLLLIGAVAMLLPLCFIVIIFVINFGGG